MEWLRQRIEQQVLGLTGMALNEIDFERPPGEPGLMRAPEAIDLAVLKRLADDPLAADVREQIKAASPHVALIAERMIQKIRAQYSLDDEMFFARIGVGAATGMYTPTAGEMADMQAFGEFVESVRQWGRTERVKLGLG